MLEKVKLALRITHNRLDNDILETIETARSEMIRAGVPADVANGDRKEIEMAVKTYCLFIYQDERYNESWLYQLDCIRKSYY